MLKQKLSKPFSRVFTIRDTNKPSEGLIAKQIKMRNAQRENLSRMGIQKRIVNDSVKGN